MQDFLWAASLTLVRHGESEGNLADAAAQEAHADMLDLDIRDPDVDLSDVGVGQAEALGRWLKTLREDDRPEVGLISPYQRARRTAEVAVEAAGAVDAIRLKGDERLRERELGVLDGLTSTGIRKRLPEEVDRRDRLGKFYYRPPVGESWADVGLRVRSVVATLQSGYPGRRVLIVSHQAVVMVFRYVLEELTEQDLLDIDRDTQLANCSITRYTAKAGDEMMTLQSYNSVAHLAEDSEEITEEADAATPAN
ncbi:MAG: histidine phosphatase family protein [Nocardioidaceae bacterium]|nr:histidine phosphatase family protein [Nocardioidaceae bacterium]